jgi:hypothetical protein
LFFIGKCYVSFVNNSKTSALKLIQCLITHQPKWDTIVLILCSNICLIKLSSFIFYFFLVQLNFLFIMLDAKENYWNFVVCIILKINYEIIRQKYIVLFKQLLQQACSIPRTLASSYRAYIKIIFSDSNWDWDCHLAKSSLNYVYSTYCWLIVTFFPFFTWYKSFFPINKTQLLWIKTSDICLSPHNIPCVSL